METPHPSGGEDPAIAVTSNDVTPEKNTKEVLVKNFPHLEFAFVYAEPSVTSIIRVQLQLAFYN